MCSRKATLNLNTIKIKKELKIISKIWIQKTVNEKDQKVYTTLVFDSDDSLKDEKAIYLRLQKNDRKRFLKKKL